MSGAWDRIREALGRETPSVRPWLASVSAKEEGRSLVLLGNPLACELLKERCGGALDAAGRLAGYERVVWRVLPSPAGGFRPTAGNEGAWRVLSGLPARWRPDLHPVLLRGPSGSGKTAMLEELAKAAAARGIAPVVSTSAVRLSRRISLAARDGRQAGVRAQLRGARLLLVDAADSLTGKVRTQAELVHALDELRNAGGIGILAFREPPRGLDERLASRLSQGLELEVIPA